MSVALATAIPGKVEGTVVDAEGNTVAVASLVVNALATCLPAEGKDRVGGEVRERIPFGGQATIMVLRVEGPAAGRKAA